MVEGGGAKWTTKQESESSINDAKFYFSTKKIFLRVVHFAPFRFAPASLTSSPCTPCSLHNNTPRSWEPLPVTNVPWGTSVYVLPAIHFGNTLYIRFSLRYSLTVFPQPCFNFYSMVFQPPLPLPIFLGAVSETFSSFLHIFRFACWL